LLFKTGHPPAQSEQQRKKWQKSLNAIKPLRYGYQTIANLKENSKKPIAASSAQHFERMTRKNDFRSNFSPF